MGFIVSPLELEKLYGKEVHKVDSMTRKPSGIGERRAWALGSEKLVFKC